MPLYMRCVSRLVSPFMSYDVLCITFLDSSLGSSLVLSFGLSIALSFVKLLFFLEYSRSAYFFFYIINLEKQLYVELAANQYRYLVLRCWVSCAFNLSPCFLFYSLWYLIYCVFWLVSQLVSCFLSLFIICLVSYQVSDL